MPLVAFRPSKARLVIEQSRESVLVMKVFVAKGETVDLTTGGKLEMLSGVLRIRERKGDQARADARTLGSLVFIDKSGRGYDQRPAKFQINISVATEKFNWLLKVAISGRLPSKFFVDIGERIAGGETRGIGYRLRHGARVKVWDNRTYRSIPVTNFAAILPIIVPEGEEGQAQYGDEDQQMHVEHLGGPGHQEGDMADDLLVATNAQVAELADDLLVFQSETKHTLTAVVSVIAVIGVLLLLVNIVLLVR
jgi:hypothetical protein